MVAQIFGDLFRTLVHDRFLGMPILVWIIVLSAILNVIDRKAAAKSKRSAESYLLPGSEAPKTTEKGWSDLRRGPLRVLRTAIKIGFVGWMLAGAVILFLVFLVIIFDLACVAIYGNAFSLRMITSNIAPAVYGLVLFGFGVWFWRFFRANPERDSAYVYDRNSTPLIIICIVGILLFIIDNQRGFGIGSSILFLFICSFPVVISFAALKVKAGIDKRVAAAVEKERMERKPEL